MSQLIDYVVKDIVLKIENKLKEFRLKTDEKIDDAIKAVPVPENGKDGVSVTVEDVRTVIEELVKGIEVPQPDITHLEQRVDDAIKAIPVPENGKDGVSVTVEDVRPVIEELVKGIEVPQPDITHLEQRVDDAIKAIPVPQDGRDGRDAIDLEILPEIVFSKTYPVGVYAYHNGGLWRTVNRTKDVAGWECIVDGVHDVDVEFDGERKFTITLSKSSGAKIEKTFKTPHMIDKGVFTEKESYDQGDTVTFGGSMWVAQKENPEGKPGSSEDWRLSVKKGRDGRESVKIERQIDKVKV